MVHWNVGISLDNYSQIQLKDINVDNARSISIYVNVCQKLDAMQAGWLSLSWSFKALSLIKIYFQFSAVWAGGQAGCKATGLGAPFPRLVKINCSQFVSALIRRRTARPHHSTFTTQPSQNGWDRGPNQRKRHSRKRRRKCLATRRYWTGEGKSKRRPQERGH